MNQYLINTKIKEKIHRIQTLIFHILTVKGRPTEVYAELGKLGGKRNWRQWSYSLKHIININITNLQTKFRCLFCNKTCPKHDARIWCIGAACDCSNYNTTMLKLCWLSLEWKFCHFLLFFFWYSKPLQYSKTIRKNGRQYTEKLLSNKTKWHMNGITTTYTLI